MAVALSTILYGLLTLVLISVIAHTAQQILLPNRSRPPTVFSLFPLIGSTVSYGADPYAFFFACRAKYGDIFTFTLLGMKVTVYLGADGNNFILNGKHRDLNAEEVYGPLTIPVFGKGVVYDVPNERFMEQKKFLKEGFTGGRMRKMVPLFVKETELFLESSPEFRGKTDGGAIDISSVLSEISLYAASGSLQGKEVRALFDSSFATVYRHLDDGFAPVNFMLPGLPIPINWRRDRAQKTMQQFYLDIIRKRREQETEQENATKPEHDEEKADMISALLHATYKDGTPLSDPELANLMIALLMGGQHNTAASGTWIMLHLAHQPQLIEELYAEQAAVLGPDRVLTFDAIPNLKLHNNVIKETLRLHSPIHSIMRKVKRDMPVPGTDTVVPKGHILLSAPGVPSRQAEFFPDPLKWDPRRWDDPTMLERINAAAASGGASGEGGVASSPYLPFGAGRHRCVGETFAYAQLLGIVATLVRRVKWEQVDPDADVPKTDYSSMFSRPVHPARVMWSWRET
ncbi:Eburicol 14-alpha-demethylase [Cyphellophora attinorum]|uniref:sterol 14alpha-demethylase n=1 Tax=Cyphellophora attinorum TaxID=1664694 RepID=A0A0N1NZT0_9EURO|nr:Eburicol 14-alpha-demethylase [Phialophora attinorum]KPI42086.1 Eburicol 14-alpha-demethylase [Phialophora attinorum]